MLSLREHDVLSEESVTRSAASDDDDHKLDNNNNNNNNNTPLVVRTLSLLPLLHQPWILRHTLLPPTSTPKRSSVSSLSQYTNEFAMTTESAAPPSLEEMPPNAGTILELHSIAPGWDGMLVVFEKPDKVNAGKLFAWPLNGKDGNGNPTDQAFRVKEICCRRPDIKPFKL